MSKAREIVNTQKLVEDILRNNPATRNSDLKLLQEVIRAINKDALYAPLHVVLSNYSDYGLPSFETVRRTRQKMQAQYVELRGNAEVEAHRMVNEAVFRDYATQ